MEEPASKKLLDKAIKEDNGVKDSAKEWEMSPASVSCPLLFILVKELVCYLRVFREPITLANNISPTIS